MDERDYDSPAGPRGTGLGWFWLGTGIGFLFSATVVAVAAELTRRRYYTPPGVSPYEQSEGDLIEDISHAVEGGLHTLAQAAQVIGHTFGEARRELIRFGLDPASTSSSSSYAWYMGEDDDPRPGE